MTITDSTELNLKPFPDHTQLPESDGTFVKNFQEHPQSILLTDSIRPILDQLHPDEQYAIGHSSSGCKLPKLLRLRQDCGIYWRETEPPEKGAVAPDWFYVPNVPPTIDGIRRSYVLWQELIAPLIVIEFVTPLSPPYRREDKEKFLLKDGSEERDQTPLRRNQPGSQKPGKFWVYEQIIHSAFYAIYEVEKASVEVYHLVDSCYEQVVANERGHYPISRMGVELGIWQGRYGNSELPWLRWWDSQGNLLLTGFERAEVERQRAETERQRAETQRQRAELAESELEQQLQQTETERQRAERLAQRLRELGMNPDEI